jgi:uncharacterized protein (DUF4415 family)
VESLNGRDADLLVNVRDDCGSPRSESPKVHIGFRLAADVVNGIKANGKGYNARVERVLREAIAKGKL